MNTLLILRPIPAKVSEVYRSCRLKENIEPAFMKKGIKPVKKLLVVEYDEYAVGKTLKKGRFRMAGNSNRIFINSNLSLIDCCKTTDGVFERGHSNVTNYGVKCCKKLIFTNFTPRQLLYASFSFLLAIYCEGSR